jgi:hypothetical protein
MTTLILPDRLGDINHMLLVGGDPLRPLSVFSIDMADERNLIAFLLEILGVHGKIHAGEQNPNLANPISLPHFDVHWL